MTWWYLLIRAARYMHVAPWDLARHPHRQMWQAWALMCESIDQNMIAFNKWRAERDARFYGQGR